MLNLCDKEREEAEIRKGWSEHKQRSTKWIKVFSERNDMFLGKGRRLNKFPGDDLKEKKQSKCRDIWLDILSHHMYVCSFNYIKKLKHVLSWKVMHSCISMWTRNVAINILTKWHILSFLICVTMRATKNLEFNFLNYETKQFDFIESKYFSLDING